MSAHNVLHNIYKAPFLMDDPGDGENLQVDRWLAVFPITTAGSETRILTAVTKAGLFCLVEHDVDGGDFTLTVNPTSGTCYGYNQANDTTIAFVEAGDWVLFGSVKIGSEYVWRILQSEGVAITRAEGSVNLLDDEYVDFGTGNDRRMAWDGTYLACGPATGMWAGSPSPADPQYHAIAHEVFDDFHKLDSTATVGGWAAFNVGTGTTTLADEVAGGELLLTCQATTDNASEQLNFVSASFLLAAGKTIWYETRLKQTGDVQSEVSFGLVALGEDLTAVADVYPADGISFAHQDTSMALALTASKNGTNTGASAGVHTMVTATYATYGLLIDGVTSITPYINGTAGSAITATIPDDESLSPYFLVRNGDATTQQILTVDYVKCVQLR